jgi:hypothetical protein
VGLAVKRSSATILHLVQPGDMSNAEALSGEHGVHPIANAAAAKGGGDASLKPFAFPARRRSCLCVAVILENLIPHGNDEILPNLRRVAYLALPVRFPAASTRRDSMSIFTIASI